ncbi:MAG: hypothetical protein OEV78_07060 [Spirochaetia bacterium]|nr:hypothetical protein [Spirochaetia bacterium]
MKLLKQKINLLFKIDYLTIFICLLVCTLYCAGTEKITRQNLSKNELSDLKDLKQEEIIPRSESEIADMIEDLKGKTIEQWKSDLPYYYGLDIRNNKSMIIIKYCEKKQCSREDYSLFLVYRNVKLNQCIDLSSQPLSNPVNNEFIGCEPAVTSLKK